MAARERTDGEVAAAAVRMVTALGVRLAQDDPTEVVLLADVDAAVVWAYSNAVAGWREAQFSDAEIGRALGVSKQAVQQRWPRPEACASLGTAQR
jgi:hypothetical protein